MADKSEHSHPAGTPTAVVHPVEPATKEDIAALHDRLDHIEALLHDMHVPLGITPRSKKPPAP